MNSTAVQTRNGKLIVKISLIFFVIANMIWLFIPFLMAGLWSFVDPNIRGAIRIFCHRLYHLNVGLVYGKKLRYLKRC